MKNIKITIFYKIDKNRLFSYIKNHLDRRKLIPIIFYIFWFIQINFLLIFLTFFKNPFFYKCKSDLNTFFFNPGQDWSQVRWSRDHFLPSHIVFRFFPRPNFEIAARGRTWRFAPTSKLTIFWVLRVFQKNIKKYFHKNKLIFRSPAPWKTGI